MEPVLPCTPVVAAATTLAAVARSTISLSVSFGSAPAFGGRGVSGQSERAALVAAFQGVRDVGRGQGGEDERLQQLNQQLEQEHGQHHDRGGGREQQTDAPAGQVPGGQGEDQQQQVTGEHVGEQPDAEGERLDDEVAEQLDRDQDDEHEDRHVARDHVPDVAPGALALEPHVEVDQVHHQDQGPREAAARHRRELEERDDFHQFAEVDEEEQ